MCPTQPPSISFVPGHRPVSLTRSTFDRPRPPLLHTNMSVDGSSSSTPPVASSPVASRRHTKTPSTASFYPTHATRASYSVPKTQSQFAAPFKPLAEQETIQDRAEAVSSALEDVVDSYSHPIKPWLPAIGRFLIVVTFLEDALRYVFFSQLRLLQQGLQQGRQKAAMN